MPEETNPETKKPIESWKAVKKAMDAADAKVGKLLTLLDEARKDQAEIHARAVKVKEAIAAELATVETVGS